MDNKIFNDIINEYKNFDCIEAIAIGGSSAAKTSDNSSDIDIYVFTTNSIPIELREQIVKKISSKYEVGGEYFGSGDEYFVNALNIQFDVMFWDKNWFENVIENVWVKHYPSNGYTTCFLYTLKKLRILIDKNNWLISQKNKINTVYPQELKNNIIKRNIMLLQDKPFASYYEQIKKAINRNDVVSINHRISAFLASYFDIIFAVNELLHPGEKRLINFAKTNCKLLPANFEENIEKLLVQPNQNTLKTLDEIIQNLRNILP